MLASGAVPAPPMPLLPRAPAMPATCVPWSSFPEMGFGLLSPGLEPELLVKSQPLTSSM